MGFVLDDFAQAQASVRYSEHIYHKGYRATFGRLGAFTAFLTQRYFQLMMDLSGSNTIINQGRAVCIAAAMILMLKFVEDKSKAALET